MDNPERLVALCTQDEDNPPPPPKKTHQTIKQKTQHNMCWAALHVNKHK